MINQIKAMQLLRLAAEQPDHRVAKALIDRYSKPQISENKL